MPPDNFLQENNTVLCLQFKNPPAENRQADPNVMITKLKNTKNDIS